MDADEARLHDAPMGLLAEEARLKESLRRLSAQWETVTVSWKDAKRAEFEEKHLANLVGKTRSAMEAIGQLAPILSRVRRDCI